MLLARTIQQHLSRTLSLTAAQWGKTRLTPQVRTTCDASRRRYADYLYGVLVHNTEQLAAARPSGSPAALSNGTGKRSLSAAHAGGKKGAGKDSKRQAQEADARHARELAQVPHASVGLSAAPTCNRLPEVVRFAMVATRLI